MVIDRLKKTFDPLVRLILLSIVLASIVPVTGEGRAIARTISDCAIFLLFFLNGLRLPRGEVMKGIGNARFLLPMIVWSFGGMGLAGWALFQLSGDMLLPNVALGLIFLGVLPSTVQSATAYCSVAGGNVALSVVAAAVLNLLGVLCTGFLFSLAAGGDAPINLEWGSFRRILLILVLPFIIGQILQSKLGHFIASRGSLISWMDRGAIAIAVYVAFSAAVAQGIWNIIDAQQWAVMLGLVGMFLIFGFGGSWVIGNALGLVRGDRITFLFTGAQKSLAIGAPLASVLFPSDVAGMLLLPALFYHLMQMLISAPIAARFREFGASA